MRTSASLTIGLAAFLACAGIYAPHLGAQSAMPSQGSAEQVFADSPSVWFEEYATRARVSPTADGPFTPGGSSTYNADARPRSACGRGSPSSGEPPSVHAESSCS